MRYIKLSHEVVHARYDGPSGKWHVRIRRQKADAQGETEEIEDTADVLLTAFGALSRWKMPDIPGLADFKGKLHHSAGFDPEDKTWQEVAEQWRDKQVGVVGVVWTFSSHAFASLTQCACVATGIERAATRPCAPAARREAGQLRPRQDLARRSVRQQHIRAASRARPRCC